METTKTKFPVTQLKAQIMQMGGTEIDFGFNDVVDYLKNL